MSHENNDAPKTESLNFIERIIEEHNETGKFDNRILTRFPPEPNGYLHIGHAKAICINFGIAQKYGGKTNLRFDDTNPMTEETRFVDAIKKDIQWLGFEWENLLFTSDYFDTLYEYALKLIQDGLAYVDFSSPKVMDEEKKQGQASEYRNTSVEANLAEFEKMKNGDYEVGTCILRLKIDIEADNRNMRDPVIYRILKAPHHRTGDKWRIYPMYDWAHGQSDSIEGITHSLCSLEFENHRPLYDWCQEKLDINRSQQIEFSRLNLDYTVTSKRKLKELIELNLVNDWDDPRMPTLSGMRRRGYTPASVRDFIERAGVSKRDQYIALSSLEGSVRDDLNKSAPRVMGVLNPLKVIITNYPEGQVEDMTVDYHQKDESMGNRVLPFSREVYIEKEDFALEVNRKWRRLAPGKDVRLKGAYIIHYTDHKTDENGEVIEVHCTYYENSRSGQDTSGIKAGVIHWVSIAQALPAQVHLYDRLFSDQNPTGHDVDFKEFLNPDSLTTVNAYLEPSLATAEPGTAVQFMRLGYFCVDTDSTKDHLIFNRTVTLKDSWTKKNK
ncbi:MAG: glutamine--tRNA ligase/YqeY domain fusion protein [Aureispira sp.]|nr:glutamine--tRNA ligase/YqeY domain fusion protein [Aureispira sp.]